MRHCRMMKGRGRFGAAPFGGGAGEGGRLRQVAVSRGVLANYFNAAPSICAYLVRCLLYG